MRKRLLGLLLLCGLLNGYAQIDLSTAIEKEGFFDYWWDEDKGKIYLLVDKLDQGFLYNHALSAGVGSNDIGLDRGQLGGAHIVRFEKHGNKLLLVEENLDYRANSDNPDEIRAVKEAFAESVWFGFSIEEERNGAYIVDLTPFLLRDVHGVVGRLKRSNQGNYSMAKERCVIYADLCKNFPQNSEFETMMTYKGEAKGGYIRSVVPTPDFVTVREHHSFIQLPDDGYSPRVYDPRSGFNMLSYADYATPINEPLVKRFITRHRLEKKDPTAEKSEAVEPIVYYVDRGAPEPVKTALIEGARWWNQAFEAAGFINAFQVEEMPEGADLLDVRYNVIQWVHRSTRGWSYGMSVRDPRTGEIIKGHVSLGSLRVRQDYLIAQGLRGIYAGTAVDDSPLMGMALARLRQLSAHEVGHTIGLAHNFAASTNDRASVMDYPHPYITSNEDQLDFSASYDDKIGIWDKRTIVYGYSDFADGVDEKEALAGILAENNNLGLAYISDRDARPTSGAHPAAHLWDNGQSAIDELNRLLKLRATALDNFSLDNIPMGMPVSELEKVLVPLYYGHRYQLDAVSKLIAGLEYRYAVKGEENVEAMPVAPEVQQQAMEAMLGSLDPKYLAVPEKTIQLLLPPAQGYRRDRESFKGQTGPSFDPVSAATSLADFAFEFMLNPERLARLQEQAARGYTFGVGKLFTTMQTSLYSYINDHENLNATIAQAVYARYVEHLLGLASHEELSTLLKGEVLQHLALIHEQVRGFAGVNAFSSGIVHQIELFYKNPDTYKPLPSTDLPDGSPIGCY